MQLPQFWTKNSVANDEVELLEVVCRSLHGPCTLSGLNVVHHLRSKLRLLSQGHRSYSLVEALFLLLVSPTSGTLKNK